MEVAWISLAFMAGLAARALGLPPLVGYLAAGFALSGFSTEGRPLLEHVAHAGVLLLLFSVGLKLRLKSLLRAEVLVGSILHMTLSAAVLGMVLYVTGGLDVRGAAMLALALSFSSTVVAAKVLEAKRELRAFHGRVAIGILIVQDVVAVALLSAASGHAPSPWALLLLALPLARPAIHGLLDRSGHDELLILFGLLLALVLGGAGFEQLGLSSELGALVLGALLADHRRAGELSNALWGLKEVFLIGFFLQIGMAGWPSLSAIAYALLLTLLLPLKALLFFFILLRFKLRARTSFLAALSLASYSEFGLIVAHLCVKQGWISEEWLVLLALTVAFSFLIAAPLNRFAHPLHSRWEQRLAAFQSRERHADDEPLHIGNSHLLIMGMGRVGTGAYDFLTLRKQRVVGLDSDVGKVEMHRNKGRRVLYADAEDPDLWQNLHLDGVEAVLLAMPDPEANVAAARALRRRGYAGLVGATVQFPEEIEAVKLAGANVVYNYYDEIGVGFAEHMWEILHPEHGPP